MSRREVTLSRMLILLMEAMIVILEDVL